MAKEVTFCREEDRACYELVFNLESFLRTLIRWEIRGRNPLDWQGLITPELVKAAKERQQQEEAIGYLDVRKSGLLSYLTLAELKDVITGPLWEKWSHDHWPPLEIVQGEFKKLIAIRNKVAHFRPVTSRDVRVAKRFGEDLTDWTRNYRRIRDYATSAKWCDSHTLYMLEKGKLSELAELWRLWSDSGVAETLRLELALIDHHVAVTVHAASGSVEPAAMCSYLEASERHISFMRIADLGESLCCYVSKHLPGPKLKSLLADYVVAGGQTTEFLSSDQVRQKYEFAEREGVIPWSMALPVEFQI